MVRVTRCGRRRRLGHPGRTWLVSTARLGVRVAVAAFQFRHQGHDPGNLEDVLPGVNFKFRDTELFGNGGGCPLAANQGKNRGHNFDFAGHQSCPF